VRRPVLLLVALSLGLLSATPPPAGAADPPPGPLLVSGNRIVDAAGKDVVLRGLHRDGTQGGPSTSPASVSAHEIDHLGNARPGSWNASVVRVPVGSAQWTGACPTLATDAAAYRAAIDTEVQRITAQGIVALLDLHTSTAGCTRIDRHAMPDAPVSQQFWADAARRFALNRLVAFELYNEPHYVPDEIWLKGTTGATLQDCDLTPPYLASPAARQAQQRELAACRKTAPKYKAAGMQELYDIVSRAAPGHLIVVNAPGWAASVPRLRVKATRGQLVYGLHPYSCSVPGAACNTAGNARANLALLKRWKPVAATVPVLVTEFGWPVYSKGYGQGYVDGAQYYRETIGILEQQSPKWGWIAFAFDGNAGGGFSLLSSTTTYAPNSTGKPVFDALRAKR
jgi:hypothetical protein